MPKKGPQPWFQCILGFNLVWFWIWSNYLYKAMIKSSPNLSTCFQITNNITLGKNRQKHWFQLYFWFWFGLNQFKWLIKDHYLFLQVQYMFWIANLSLYAKTWREPLFWQLFLFCFIFFVLHWINDLYEVSIELPSSSTYIWKRG